MNTIRRIPRSRPAPVLRTATGALDREAYERRARRLRAETLGALLGSFGRRLRSAATAVTGTARRRIARAGGHCPSPC